MKFYRFRYEIDKNHQDVRNNPRTSKLLFMYASYISMCQLIYQTRVQDDKTRTEDMSFEMYEVEFQVEHYRISSIE